MTVRQAWRAFAAVVVLFVAGATGVQAATIVGTAGNNFLRGTARADSLYGKSGNDTLWGHAGDDRLFGGPGNDVLVGGAGKDTLQCGPGHDVAMAGPGDVVAVDCEVVRGLPDLSVVVSDASVVEGNSGATVLSFAVQLSAPAWRAASVSFAVSDGSATAGSDYQAASGTIRFKPRTTSTTIDIAVNGDTVYETDETLTVTLSNPINLKLARATAVGTIRNDDAPQWHRLNPDRVNPTPQHERLQCVEGPNWTCSYDNVAEPTLNLQKDTRQAAFIGSVAGPGQWACPSWLPRDTCSRVRQVVIGTVAFAGPVDATTRQEIVITAGGDDVMWLYWPEWHLAAPWYATFERALAANPFPRPFNGTDWPAVDWLVTP